jgi:hypothetical protein
MNIVKNNTDSKRCICGISFSNRYKCSRHKSICRQWKAYLREIICDPKLDEMLKELKLKEITKIDISKFYSISNTTLKHILLKEGKEGSVLNKWDEPINSQDTTHHQQVEINATKDQIADAVIGIIIKANNLKNRCDEMEHKYNQVVLELGQLQVKYETVLHKQNQLISLRIDSENNQRMLEAGNL